MAFTVIMSPIGDVLRIVHARRWAHFMSSARGLQPVSLSMQCSKICQKRSFSSGQLSQPVVMQK
jgi:hypothetical protein